MLNNFRHVPTVNPLRFNYDASANSGSGGFVQVNQYTESSATKGKKYTINSAWRTATHEAAIVLNPNVLTTEIVAPAGYGLDFDPVNYGGEWDWITGGDRIGAVASGADPAASLGRHYAKYMAAFRPVRPQDGAVILFDRDGA